MGYKHFDDINMNADHDSGVFLFADEAGEQGNKMGFIIFSWSSVAGSSINGTIKIYDIEPASSGVHCANLLETINLAGANGVARYELTIPIEKIQFVYTKTDITGGTLKASLFTRMIGR